MPSFWTHASFAEEARQMLSDLSKARMPMGLLSRAILAYPHAFFTGMQGPDLFFFYPPSAISPKHLSSLLHTQKVPALLSTLFDCAQSIPSLDPDRRSCALSYASGFLGHYLLDSRTHAFIYAHSGIQPTAKSFCAHNALEADLSTLAVRRSLGMELRRLPRPTSYRLAPNERDTLARLLADAIGSVYGIPLSPSAIGRAFRSVDLAIGLLYDPDCRKASRAKQFERLWGRPYLSPLFLGESHYYPDPANLSHRLWIDPYTGSRSHADFWELYDSALGRFLPIIQRLESLPSPSSRRLVLEKLCKRDFHGKPI